MPIYDQPAEGLHARGGPAGFRWLHDETYGLWWYLRASDSVAIACLSERVARDGWAVSVERHLWPVRGFQAPSLSRAKAWVEGWARAHATRLLVEPPEPFGGRKVEQGPPLRKSGLPHRKK